VPWFFFQADLIRQPPLQLPAIMALPATASVLTMASGIIMNWRLLKKYQKLWGPQTIG
jgi:hypothetical protein